MPVRGLKHITKASGAQVTPLDILAFFRAASFEQNQISCCFLIPEDSHDRNTLFTSQVVQKL